MGAEYLTRNIPNKLQFIVKYFTNLVPCLMSPLCAGAPQLLPICAKEKEVCLRQFWLLWEAYGKISGVCVAKKL